MADLYLIRHAYAGERGPNYPDDSQRPLDAKGLRQAKRLRRFLQARDLRFERLFASPYARAAQTAAALEPLLRGSRMTEYLDGLTSGDYPRLLNDLQGRLEAAGGFVALVGHEPYLSELTAYLLTGDARGARLRLKKAGFLVLRGELEAGQMTLTALVPPALYRSASR